MNIFLYEHITATETDSKLLTEGKAMRDALADDMRKIAGVTLIEYDAKLGFDACVQKADAVWLIAPEFHGILYDLAVKVEQAGKRLLGPASDAIKRTSNKMRMCQHWKALEPFGIISPITIAANQFDPSRIVVPLVVKPIDGAGSIATTRVTNRKEYEHALQIGRNAGYTPDRMILQPWIEGDPCSIAFLVNERKRFALWPMWQIIDVENGCGYTGGKSFLSNKSIQEIQRYTLLAISKMPNLSGYIGVDAVVNARGLIVIELNPRLTTSYIGLRKMTEENLAERVIFPEKFPDDVVWKDLCHVEFFTDGRVVERSLATPKVN